MLACDFMLRSETAATACNYFDRFVDASCNRNRTKKDDGHIQNQTVSLVLLTILSRHGRGCTQNTVRHMREEDRRLEYEFETARATLEANLQLIASTCLLTAAKFVDRRLPPLSELVKVHHGKRSPEDFVSMELCILDVLQWKANVVAPLQFVDLLLDTCGKPLLTHETRSTADFFINLTPYSYKCLEYSPIVIAAGSLLVARELNNDFALAFLYEDTLTEACQVEHDYLVKYRTDILDYLKTHPKLMDAGVVALADYMKQRRPP